MTIYYVGAGGSDSANGQSWVNRKLTLNGVENVPVVAGDTAYVGPGVYREKLTCDVSGSSGSLITYIGDVHGVNTNGIGGPVRITGSENDKTNSRNYCVDVGARTYRTFRGFRLDGAYNQIDLDNNSTNIIIEDCALGASYHSSGTGIYVDASAAGTITLRRCYFTTLNGITINGGNADINIENCILVSNGVGVFVTGTHTGTSIVNNCTISSYGNGIYCFGATITSFDVTNSIIMNAGTGLVGVTNVSEDYNSFQRCTTDVSGISGGANSNNYPSLFYRPPMSEGYPREFFPFQPAPYSPLARIAGSGEATDDFFGITRPTTSSKKSRGAVQTVDVVRATSPLYGTTTESLEMPDAGRFQIRVPVTATSTTISIRTYREANYMGTLPQMVIKEPGQSDRTTTDTGSVTTWNLLTDTFTPDASAGFVAIEVVSNNTATSGSYSTFWAELKVTA